MDSEGKEKHNCRLGASEKNKYFDSIQYQLVGDKYQVYEAQNHIHLNKKISPTFISLIFLLITINMVLCRTNREKTLQRGRNERD